MPLYLFNGKLLIQNGKLATSDKCCCGNCEYAILLCNSNAQKDNPFNIILNGQQIGTHILRDDGTIDGEFFVTHPDITLDMLSCENCEVCEQDDPWVQDTIALPPDFVIVIPNPAYVPGKDGFDLSNFALCQDCIGQGITPIPGEPIPPPWNIRTLPLDKNLINENGNNTFTLVNPLMPPQDPPLQGSYGRIWFIRFKFNTDENKFKVDAILLSTAFADGDPYVTFNYEFNVSC